MKIPGTFAAAFSCVPLSAVPAEIGAGVGQVIDGLVLEPEEAKPDELNWNEVFGPVIVKFPKVAGLFNENRTMLLAPHSTCADRKPPGT